jgi:hypothetical protein
MKNSFSNLFFSYFLVSFIVFLGSCHQSNDDSFSPISGTTVNSGLWKINYFWDKKDETNDFANFTFDFASNGTLTVKNGSQSYSGTWTTGTDDSKSKFIINFNGTVPSVLSELQEDWIIMEITDNSMHFEHISGGNGDTEILKFELI